MNAVAPTMLSSSNVPQPEFACWWPSSPSEASSAAYSGRCSPFMSRCCQSMLIWTLSIPVGLELVHDVQAHADVAHQDLHRRLGVLVLEQQLDPVLGTHLRGFAHTLDQPAPGVDVGGLERIVVALAAGPDDQVRAQRPRELRGVADDLLRLGAQRRIRVDQSAAAEPRIEVQAAGDAVDVVARQRRPGPRTGSPRTARWDSGTRSRRSDRRAPRPPGGPCRRPARGRSCARADSRPARNA